MSGRRYGRGCSHPIRGVLVASPGRNFEKLQQNGGLWSTLSVFQTIFMRAKLNKNLVHVRIQEIIISTIPLL
jgi:hypothetical protein